MLQKIYENSPIFFQNLMVSVKGYQIFKERYNEDYKKELLVLLKNKNKFKMQEYRLKDFYNYITNNSEYFSELKKIIPSNLKLDEIEHLPTMDKEVIRENLEKIVTRKENIIEMDTEETTRKNKKNKTHNNNNYEYSHPYYISRKIDYLDYFKAKHGVYFGMRRVSVGGRPIVPVKQKRKIFWRYNFILNQLYISAYHADGDNLKYYINKLNKFK